MREPDDGVLVDMGQQRQKAPHGASLQFVQPFNGSSDRSAPRATPCRQALSVQKGRQTESLNRVPRSTFRPVTVCSTPISIVTAPTR